MVRALGITLTCLVLAACATGSGFSPQTNVGTQCKATCGQEKASCKSTSTLCERRNASCLAGCQELDLLNSRR